MDVCDLIDIQQVTVRRGEKRLLDGVDWKTRRGEHWALLGANGAGKTTLLQTLLGYLWPTSGRVQVLGHVLGRYDVRKLRQAIGFVSVNMDARLEPNDSALAIVESGRDAAYGMYHPASSEDRMRAQTLSAEMGVQDLAGQPYRILSQGEKQKVLIARALMADPAVLVLDEPCNGLDFPSRERLLATIEMLGKRDNGPQLIYVTHYPDEIVPAMSHVLMLRDGGVVAAGEKRAVLTEELLTKAFAIPVSVQWQNECPMVRVRWDGPYSS